MFGANDATVVGGRIKLNSSGQIETSQWSGHYGGNWTPEIVKQFKLFMKERVGRDIEQTGAKEFSNGGNK